MSRYKDKPKLLTIPNCTFLFSSNLTIFHTLLRVTPHCWGKIRQTSVWQMVPKVWFICHFYCFSKTVSTAKRRINQKFGSICHTEVNLTFLRLAAKRPEMIAKFQGRSLKNQPWSSFDLNGLNNGMRKYFRNSIKPFQILQILMVGIEF